MARACVHTYACTLMHLLKMYRKHTPMHTTQLSSYFQMCTPTFTRQCTWTHLPSQVPCVYIPTHTEVFLSSSQRVLFEGLRGYCRPHLGHIVHTSPDSLKGKRQAWCTLTVNLEQRD